MRESYKRLIENTISLGLVNGMNLLIPMITLPYLIKTVGIANYGAYSIVYAMLQYGILFSAYGFGFTTTQAIAKNREDVGKVSEIVIATISARFLIMIVIGLIMAIICIVFYPKEYFIMYLWGIGIVVGDVLNPTWLYQGMEKMKFMTLINLLSKSVFTLLIFVFIKKESDYPYITLLNSVGFVLAGIVSLVMGYKIFKLKYKRPKLRHIKDQYKAGWYLFLSTLCMNLYRNSNIFILGFFVSSSAVGIYSGAEKVIKAFQAIISPLATALFPYVARSFKSVNRLMQWKMIRKMSYYFSLFLLMLALVAYITAPLVNKYLLDGQNSEAIVLIRVMTPVILFGGLNYILGIVGLVNVGENKQFFNSVLISGVLSVLLLFILIKPWGVLSASVSMTASEIILCALCVYYWMQFKKKPESECV